MNYTDNAPPYSTKPFSYALHLIHNHFDAFRRFHDLARRYEARRPESRYGAQMILEKLRYDEEVRTGVDFKINNNSRGVFARLHLELRPNSNITYRDSVLDHGYILTDPEGWFSVLTAFRNAWESPPGPARPDEQPALPF